MIIDLSSFLGSNLEVLPIDMDVSIRDDLLASSLIRKLVNVRFVGEVKKLIDGRYSISGNISGKMILPDDITGEDVDYLFDTKVEEKFDSVGMNEEENLEIVQNSLDIEKFLWQNILVEIPSKVTLEKNKDLILEGDGWRLVTEDEIKVRNDNPFSELSKMFDSGKE